MGPDFRVITKKAQKKANTYYATFHVYNKLFQMIKQEQIPCTILVQEIASIMQEYTQSGGVRPFGISLLIIGYDQDTPRLYQVDPSGAYFAWYATAIGKNYISGKSFLEKVMVCRYYNRCRDGIMKWKQKMQYIQLCLH